MEKKSTWHEKHVEVSTLGQRLADTALIPVLVKAIQELSAKNEALLARIVTLENI